MGGGCGAGAGGGGAGEGEGEEDKEEAGDPATGVRLPGVPGRAVSGRVRGGRGEEGGGWVEVLLCDVSSGISDRLAFGVEVSTKWGSFGWPLVDCLSCPVGGCATNRGGGGLTIGDGKTGLTSLTGTGGWNGCVFVWSCGLCIYEVG